MTDPFSKLPITDPDYRYPASRNLYWIKLNSSSLPVFLDQSTERNKGLWRNQFHLLPSPSPQTRLHLEIGCNAGHVITEWARLQPQTLFIGLDWKHKAIYRALEKATRAGLKNLLFFRAWAERLTFMFAPDELDEISLFFPDPWPKTTDQKKRFFSLERLQTIHRILKPGGIFHIKTDHGAYIDWIEKHLPELTPRFEILSLKRDIHKDHPDPLSLKIPEITLFEKIFIRQKIPIHEVRMRKK